MANVENLVWKRYCARVTVWYKLCLGVLFLSFYIFGLSVLSFIFIFCFSFEARQQIQYKANRKTCSTFHNFLPHSAQSLCASKQILLTGVLCASSWPWGYWCDPGAPKTTSAHHPPPAYSCSEGAVHPYFQCTTSACRTLLWHGRGHHCTLTGGWSTWAQSRLWWLVGPALGRSNPASVVMIAGEIGN